MRRLRFLAPVLGLTLLLGACGSDDSPKAEADPTPSGAASASPSGSPSASASDVADPSASPVPTKAPAGETAEEFIRRWLSLEYGMEQTGDTAAYRAASKGCTSCDRTADAVESYYRAGGYVAPSPGVIRRLRKQDAIPGYTVYLVDLNYAPSTYKRGADRKAERFEGGPITYKMTLRKRAGLWNVDQYTNYVS